MESTFPQVLKRGLLGGKISKRERGLDTGSIIKVLVHGRSLSVPTKPTLPSYPASNNTHCGSYAIGYLICSYLGHEKSLGANEVSGCKEHLFCS